MTPRAAEVAHVLEGVPGVVATYALAANPHDHYDFAVHVDDTRTLAQAYYALERVGLHHRDARVCFFRSTLAAPIAARATRIELTDRERVAASRCLRLPASDTAGVFDLPNVAFSRLMHSPAPSAPFTVLLVDVDDDVQSAMRRIFREESRHLVSTDARAAAELALTRPFHFVVCGHRAAAFQGFLPAIAREDPCGVERVVVLAPARDVEWTRWHLGKQRRSNAILALPIDDALLQREAFRDHPELLERVAMRDLSVAGTGPLRPPRFRRMRVLVVDEAIETQILFASEPTIPTADVVFAKTSMEAFEEITSRPIDILVIGASMRSDGGEPLYRLLWRLEPKTKTRTVLLTTPDAVPASAPASTRPRIVERPLQLAAIQRVIDAYSDA